MPATNATLKREGRRVAMSRAPGKYAELIYVFRDKTEQGIDADLFGNNCVLFDRAVDGSSIKEIYIRHPFKSGKIEVRYGESVFLDLASEVCESESLDKGHPTATVIVKHDKILGHGANGSDYHAKHGCERKRLNVPTGRGYELCEGCHPKNHSEAKAVGNAVESGRGDELRGATAYLYGHWWCCPSCYEKMEQVGIEKAVLSKEWTGQFLKI